MTKTNLCQINSCNEKTMVNSNFCCKDHEEMAKADDILNEMLWNGEIPFQKS